MSFSLRLCVNSLRNICARDDETRAQTEMEVNRLENLLPEVCIYLCTYVFVCVCVGILNNSIICKHIQPMFIVISEAQPIWRLHGILGQVFN